MAALRTSDEQFNQQYTGVGAGAKNNKDTSRRTSPRNVQVETIRTSTMPGAPQNKSFNSSKRDSATQFNEEYSKKGLQPSSIDDKPAHKPYQPVDQVTRSAAVTYGSQPMVQPGVSTQKRRIKLRKKHGAKASIAKARATGANVGIWSWAFYTWFWFQLPIAIISVLFMGMTQILYEVFNTTQIEHDADPSLWATTYAWVAGGVSGILSVLDVVTKAFLKFVGIDLSILNPGNVYMLTVFILMALGVMTLMAIYFIYKSALLNPLSGKAAGFKWGMFFLSLTGYTVGSMFPLANMFPWFIFWTMAVWWYPK